MARRMLLRNLLKSYNRAILNRMAPNFFVMFKQLQLIFFALLAGQVIFAAVVYYAITQSLAQTSEIPMFTFLIPVVVLSAVAMSYFLNNVLKSQASAQKTTDEKSIHYRRRVILRSAIMEGGNLMAIIAVLMTGQMYFMLYFLLGIIIFYFFRPTEQEMQQDYQEIL